MFYVLMYSLLAFGSKIILEISQAFIANTVVVLFTIGIFYLMYKRHVNDFGGVAKFKQYHLHLINIEQADEKVEEIEQLTKENQYSRAKQKLTKIVSVNNIIEQPFNDGSDVVIDDPRFVVDGKKWAFLLFIYNMEGIYVSLLTDLAFYIVSILTVGLLSFIIFPLLIESWHGLKNIGWKKTILWMILGALLLLVLNVANDIFFQIVDFEVIESANQAVIEIMLKENFFRFAFEAIIMAAILEEIIFRGLFFRNIYGKNKLLAYTVTFFTFGMPHLLMGFIVGNGLSEFMFLPLYGMMGVILAFVYDKTNSIFTAIGAHFLNNLISIILIALN